MDKFPKRLVFTIVPRDGNIAVTVDFSGDNDINKIINKWILIIN